MTDKENNPSQNADQALDNEFTNAVTKLAAMGFDVTALNNLSTNSSEEANGQTTKLATDSSPQFFKPSSRIAKPPKQSVPFEPAPWKSNGLSSSS